MNMSLIRIHVDHTFNSKIEHFIVMHVVNYE